MQTGITSWIFGFVLCASPLVLREFIELHMWQPWWDGTTVVAEINPHFTELSKACASCSQENVFLWTAGRQPIYLWTDMGGALMHKGALLGHFHFSTLQFQLCRKRRALNYTCIELNPAFRHTETLDFPQWSSVPGLTTERWGPSNSKGLAILTCPWLPLQTDGNFCVCVTVRLRGSPGRITR